MPPGWERRPRRPPVHAQFDRATEQLAELFPAAEEMRTDAGPDILAFAGFPFAH